jgi:hypothetical protein
VAGDGWLGEIMIRAYHFVSKTLRDGSPIPPDGEWLEFTGNLRMCESGLHASRCPWDALKYAPDATLCLVDCDGDIIEQDDKLVCARRRIVARFDATGILRKHARDSALSVIHLWAAPAIVREYLETCDDSKRAAAWSAAWDAARAAGEAARDAAGAAAWDAARAAGEAARAAARDAAWAAAQAAAWAAGAARDAAGEAAWTAARDAAWTAARSRFVDAVEAKFSVKS